MLGGVKVGTGLSIAAGVLSASGTTATDATTAKAGLVTLADAAAITAGTAARIPDAAQLKGQVDVKAPKANPSFTGVVHIPLGTAAAPSLTFTGDTDTGIYEAGSNSVGIAAGGVSALEVTATGTTVTGTLTAGGLKYPNTPGTKDQVLASDGAGNVAWQTVAAGTTYTLPAATPLALGGVKIADAAAVTLGAAGFVVDAAQLKAANDLHVLKAGDTMTGVLKVAPTKTGAAPHGSISIVGESQQAHLSVERYSDAPAAGPINRFYRMRGTETAPQTVKAGDNLGQIIWHTKRGDGLTGSTIRISAVCLEDPPATPGQEPQASLSLATGEVSSTPQITILKAGVGILWSTPTHPLEVGGNSMLRGTLDVTGNITSTGTAHNFVATSIPASAIDGGLTIPNKTPAGQTAPGTAGEFAWDASYLYGCIAANQWRRIPWTDWHGNTLPGSGAGATDTALAAPKTNATAMVKATAADNPKSAMVGKIIIKLMEALPALSTGVKVQYRIHGGNWVDATVLEYSTTDTSPLFADWDALKKSTAPLTTARCVTISGPAPGTPYLTRLAYTSSLGVGAWSDEMAAVTPTA